MNIQVFKRERRYFNAKNRGVMLVGVFLLLLFLIVIGKSGTQVKTPEANRQNRAQAHVQQRRTEAQQGSTPAPTSQPMSRLAIQADDLLTQQTSQQQFSGTVLIAHNGQVLLNKGYSMADWNSQIANTSDTRFYLGSTTKQFTAMAILILQQQGKLNVENSICATISPCPDAWQAVTLHTILTHTSGIPELDDASLSSTSPQAWIDSYQGVPLAFTPGSQYTYCSICYQILGYVIEQVSGEAYSDFLQQAIFTPLQMNNSGMGDANYTSVANSAVGYAAWQDAGGSGMNVDPQWTFLFGSGLIYSTTGDMSRWDQALMNGTLVSQATLKEAFTPYIASQYSGSGYGYGWFIEQDAGQRLIWHDGKIPGFRTYNGFYPTNGYTLVILSNLATLDEIALADQLEKLMLAST